MKRLETAIQCHRRALALAPRSPMFHHNLGIALSLANQHTDAIAEFNQSLALAPDDPHVLWDRGRSYLHLGDYAFGWAGYEARLQTGDLPRRPAPGKRWRGEQYAGKTLLLISEQGIGDAIWAARYLERVKSLGGELIVECRRELIPLLESLGCIDRVVAKADPLPEADLHDYLCSVPGLFTNDLFSIPTVPYFQTFPDRAEKFSPAMAKAGSRLRVGIVWSGSTTFKGNKDRAVPLRFFLKFFSLPSVQLYSLQKGSPEAELNSLPKGAPIIDLAPLITDFSDTAAAVGQLDLVIMTDSAVAHLGGALGKPVWVLLNYVPHWLWLLDRTDSPWYPSLRLFRQRAWGDWLSVFDSATAALIDLCESKHRGAGI
jgi:hypothetical protein